VLLIYLSLAWLMGIGAGYYCDLPPAVAAVCLLPLACLSLTRRHQRFNARNLILTACLLLIFTGAAVYSSASQIRPDSRDIGQFHGLSGTVISGEIREQPEYGGDYTRFRLDISQISIDGNLHDASGAALVYLPVWADCRYGDRLTVTGTPDLPPQFDGFDYRGYLAEQGITAIIYYPETVITSRDNGNPALAAIFDLRAGLAANLARTLPEPEASLAQGIILGIRVNIPDPVRDDFSITGTAHLLAISGLHISIVTLLVLALALRIFGRRRYIYVWLTLLLVWLYTMLTGLHPPVVRAAIMVSLFLVTELLGRQRSILTALCFTAAVMVAVNPGLLRSASFQMSFSAMLGLIFITPLLQTAGQRIITTTLGETTGFAATARLLNDLLGISLGAVLAVGPLVAYYFGIISLVGPLATLLALPLLPLIIIFGMLSALAGFFAPFLSQALAWLTWPFIAGLNQLVSGFAATGLAAISLDNNGNTILWLIAVYYTLLIAVTIYRRHRQTHDSNDLLTPEPSAPMIMADTRARFLYRRAIPLLALVAVLATAAIINRDDENLQLTFLDVGQGDAILIRTPAGQDILIDGGVSPKALNLALGKELPFWDRRLEMVIITHPHADHFGGLITLMERYQIDRVLYAPTENDSPSWQELRRRLEVSDIMSTPAQAGQQILLGNDAVIDIINPPSTPGRGTTSDEDNNAVIMTVSTGDISFLLTADLYWDGEYALLRRRAVTPTTVLKIPHHGADTSTTAELLAAADPAITVISVGIDNKYGHPDGPVLDRLNAATGIDSVYRTDLHGNIRFVTDGYNLRVRTER
jgi:competence protein ComEC